MIIIICKWRLAQDNAIHEYDFRPFVLVQDAPT